MSDDMFIEGSLFDSDLDDIDFDPNGGDGFRGLSVEFDEWINDTGEGGGDSFGIKVDPKNPPPSGTNSPSSGINIPADPNGSTVVEGDRMPGPYVGDTQDIGIPGKHAVWTETWDTDKEGVHSSIHRWVVEDDPATPPSKKHRWDKATQTWKLRTRGRLWFASAPPVDPDVGPGDLPEFDSFDAGRPGSSGGFGLRHGDTRPSHIPGKVWRYVEFSDMHDPSATGSNATFAYSSGEVLIDDPDAKGTAARSAKLWAALGLAGLAVGGGLYAAGVFDGDDASRQADAEVRVDSEGEFDEGFLDPPPGEEVTFGFDNEQPIVGDFDGEGTDDISVYRSNSFFFDLNRTQWTGVNFSDIQLLVFGLETDEQKWAVWSLPEVASRSDIYIQSQNGRAWQTGDPIAAGILGQVNSLLPIWTCLDTRVFITPLLAQENGDFNVVAFSGAEFPFTTLGAFATEVPATAEDRIFGVDCADAPPTYTDFENLLNSYSSELPTFAE